MERISFVGMNELDTETASAVEGVTEKHMTKIDKLVEDARLKLVIKQYQKEGRSKFSIDGHFTFRGDTLTVDGHGWNAPEVVSDVLGKATTVLGKRQV